METVSQSITAQERAHVVRLLEDSEKEYLSCIEDVGDPQWTWRPAPDRWSVGETAEHIALAETMLFAVVQRIVQSSSLDPDWSTRTAGKSDLLEREMPDRSRKATAPERVRPQGLAKVEVIRRFTEARANTIKFAQETDFPLKEHTAEHPFPIFKTLNAYQWLLYIPLHAQRHHQQIAEIKAAPGYPG
jgi:hypothetical protein